MKTLAEDGRLGEAQLELGCVEEQVVQAVRRWQVLAVTGLVLESVRGNYESTRQPETLREASTYLHRLTQGQYVHIWTPIQERTLQVDDQKGQTLSLDKLSRGTREAVFLSLRLANHQGPGLRAAQEQQLPMILDDVLVNFDSRRVKAAAALLRELAEHGHQLLMFTCHEHIMQIFCNERADVRLIPNRHGEPMEPAPLPEPEAFEPVAEGAAAQAEEEASRAGRGEAGAGRRASASASRRSSPWCWRWRRRFRLPGQPMPVIVERPVLVVERRPAPPAAAGRAGPIAGVADDGLLAPKPEPKDEKVVGASASEEGDVDRAGARSPLHVGIARAVRWKKSW